MAKSKREELTNRLMKFLQEMKSLRGFFYETCIQKMVISFEVLLHVGHVHTRVLSLVWLVK